VLFFHPNKQKCKTPKRYWST